MRQSRVRQLFSDDLGESECVHHCARVTVTSPAFDRPVTGWAVSTDRALRVRWGLATTVGQSLHVEYDRMRLVEVDVADPCAVRVTYFDAARTTASWYQELGLQADSTELTTALPGLVGRRRRHLAEPVDNAATPADAEGADGVLAGPEPPMDDVTTSPPARRLPARVRRPGRRRLTRR